VVGPIEALGPGQARVYYAWVAEALAAAEHERLSALLSDEERARHARFHFEHDRHSYLMAHALTRSVLGRLTGVAPPALRFELGPHGRPELCLPDGSPPVRFNLSHTRGLVACAVALAHDIGVDVEQVERRLDVQALARSVFSSEERAELDTLPSEAHRGRFFELWTLKEAYIKAVGQGLALPLRSISLQLAPGRDPRIGFVPPVIDDAEQWWCRVVQPLPTHTLAVAMRCDSEPLITVHECEPGPGES
jgi:4'-phosphopantetheinyl transferase